MQDFFTQVYEPDRLIDLFEIEEGKLLLVSQHLYRWLAEHREIDRAPVRTCQREHDLMRKRCLARTRRSGNEVEGKVGQSASKKRIEPGNSRRQTANRHSIGHRRTPAGERRRPFLRTRHE